MRADTAENKELKFLSGGGELGALILEYNWANTPLGPIDSWPQSLKTSVSLMLNSQHPVWIGWGPEATFLYNEAYVHVLSAAKHPWALGKPAAEVWAEIWDVCGPLADKVFLHGEASYMNDVRLFMKRRDFLEETFYSFSYTPIRDESGNVGGLFCPSTDVTANALNTRRLKTLSDLAVKALVEKKTESACASAAGILLSNPDDISFALLYLLEPDGRSARLEQAIGLPKTAGPFSPLKVDLQASSGKPDLWRMAEVIQTGQIQIVSVGDNESIPPGTAGQRILEAVILPIALHGHQQPLGILVAGVNPTRKIDREYQNFYELVAGHIATAIQNARSAEEEKKRADLLAELDRAKTTFFSNVSHELRTPLTLILGPLEDEMRESDAPRERIALAHRNSLRLLKLVNTLLDFSRIEAGRMETSLELTDLAVFTRELVSVFQATMDKAGLSLIVDCDALSDPVLIDRDMWEKIVFNLMSNAVKFTAQGEVEVRLIESTDNGVRYARFAVRDTGTGIPADELPHVFERFRRVKNSWSRSHEGTGIGLALVQELSRMQGGYANVESEVGRGTTFTVHIPMATGDFRGNHKGSSQASVSTSAGPLPYVQEAMQWVPDPQSIVEADSSQKEVPKGQTSQFHILLADDNADMRNYVHRLLSGHGFAVTSVGDGQAALEVVRRETPSLVLSDVMMPHLDGFGLLKELRKDPSTQAIPVILLSARAGEEALVEGVEAGADDYLFKPFNARELIARVNSHLKLSAMRKEAQAVLQRANSMLEDRAESLEKLVQVRTAKLTETVSDLESFSYSIAHDMRAPLRALQGFSNILLTDYSEALDPNAKNYLERIASSANRMDILIRDVLNYSRVVQSDFPLKAVNVDALLRDIVETYPMLAPDTADLLLEGPFPTVLGNEAMLTQIFSNLFGNGVKFVPSGVKPRLRVWAERQPTCHRFFVQDNGIGIASDQYERIFGIFQRIEKDYEGTGIGLAIVKKAVERVGGKIGLKSHKGTGTTFWIDLQPGSGQEIPP